MSARIEGKEPASRTEGTRHRSKGWILAVAGVVIALVLAAALYVYLTSSIQSGENPPPIVKPGISFSYAIVGGVSGNRTAEWTATEVSGSRNFTNFRVDLYEDDVPLGQRCVLLPDIALSFGPSVRLTARGPSNSELRAGETFLVYGMIGVHRWNLTLLWKDDSLVRFQNWNTPPLKSIVDFDTPTIGGNAQNFTANWTASGASEDLEFSNYKAILVLDGSPLSSSQDLVPNSTISFGPAVKSTISDIQGDGRLTKGDVFLVYGMKGQHSWVFKLLWTDDTEITMQNWNTVVQRPVVSFTSVAVDGTSGNQTATWSVSYVSQAQEFSMFRIDILKNGASLLSPHTLVQNTTIQFDETVSASVYDEDGDGSLTVNDVFLVYGMLGKSGWNLTLLWSDSSEITREEWNTTQVPFMAVVLQNMATNWSLIVVSVSIGLPLTAVKMTIKDSGGTAVPPMSAVPFSELTQGNWATYKVLYQKMSPTDTTVTIGSSLLVYKSAYPSGYRYEISVSSIVIAVGTFS